ncbi:MAG TPA: hypothetical protein VNJ52_13585 [Patescibacteria group bacterium]|nr:hypothetical protein [Patescibacteria group bacterium]
MATLELPATLNAPRPASAVSSPAFGAVCFFHRHCGNAADVEKQGKMLCRRCATAIPAEEFPLRAPTREPLYRSADDLVRQLGMELPCPRRRPDRAAQE